jgi:4-hydroxyphenylpyruvate dioxygenase-like putative hemolysin
MGLDNGKQSIVDGSSKSIVQIGVVVKDAVQTAKNYSRVFGIESWVFFDSIPAQATLHGETIKDGESCVRLGFGNIGKLEIELLQPLYGRSTHQEFLQDKGEGIHHISFGPTDDHDQFVSGLQNQGFEIDMSGISSGTIPFTYMATQEALGTIIEVLKPVAPEVLEGMTPWGSYTHKEAGFIDISGKEIVQVGIVVENIEKIVENYWKILGIGPWTFFDFKPPVATCDTFHGLPVFEGTEFHLRAAMADCNGIQIELLEPISGPSSHMDFLKTKGMGVHHISFDAIEDHDQLVAAVVKGGIGIEMSGIIGGANRYTYLAAQNDLHTVLEAVRADPLLESSAVPSGIYPPSA